MTENESIRIEGVLTAAEVAELHRRYRGQFGGTAAPKSVDLADVESGDSSALALFLEWQAQARASGQSLNFEQPPESLRVIARLTGVAPLLGWSEQDLDADSAKDET
jgi:ABC-type transporter Mla MlaB component